MQLIATLNNLERKEEILSLADGVVVYSSDFSSFNTLGLNKEEIINLIKSTNKKVIIDKRMRKIEKKRIQDMGYEIIEIPTNKNVYTEISSHVDIFVCRVRDEIIVEPTQNFNLYLNMEQVMMMVLALKIQ